MTKAKKEIFDKIVCQIVLPYSIRVPEEPIVFPDKDMKVSLLFKRYPRENPTEQFHFDVKYQILEKERFGRYDYSTVDIILEKKYFHYSPTDDIYKMRFVALEKVRKFIQFYKLTYDEYWLIEPSINDIVSFTINCINGNEVLKGMVGEYISISTKNRIMGFTSYLKEKEFHLSELKTKLEANFDLPLYTKLMMQGNRLFFEESYDLAIILFDQSFESFYDILVRIYMEKNNIFNNAWKKYLKMDLVGTNKKNSKIKLYSTLVSKSGKPFDENEEKYNLWYTKCRKIRNDIVHGRLSNTDSETAYMAMQAARESFVFFGWVWYDLILINQKYYNSQNNKYHIQL